MRRSSIRGAARAHRGRRQHRRRRHGTHPILISTDSVFDGTTARNTEDSPVSPANAYGRAKFYDERLLRASVPAAAVIRVSLVYGHQASDTAGRLNSIADRLDEPRFLVTAAPRARGRYTSPRTPA